MRHPYLDKSIPTSLKKVRVTGFYLRLLYYKKI